MLMQHAEKAFFINKLFLSSSPSLAGSIFSARPARRKPTPRHGGAAIKQFHRRFDLMRVGIDFSCEPVNNFLHVELKQRGKAVGDSGLKARLPVKLTPRNEIVPQQKKNSGVHNRYRCKQPFTIF